MGLEVGSSIAVTRHGRPVVDLWAGAADPKGTPWVEDTIVNGIIDLDARVSIAYVMNRMEGDLLGDTRGGSIALAAYQAL